MPLKEEKKKNEPTRKIVGVAIVQDGPLNIRTAPSKENGDIVGKAQKGQRFNVTTGSTSDYTAIIYKDEVRYAMSQYLEVTNRYE